MSEPDLAQRAIDYLVQTDLVLKWDFPEADPPSHGDKRASSRPYFCDGEIERTTLRRCCATTWSKGCAATA